MVMEEINTTTPELNNDELKQAIEVQMRKIQSQSMAVGAQAICSVILQKIVTAYEKGKLSYRDYERLVKDIQTFCMTGLKRNVTEQNEIIEENTDESRDSETSNE